MSRRLGGDCGHVENGVRHDVADDSEEKGAEGGASLAFFVSLLDRSSREGYEDGGRRINVRETACRDVVLLVTSKVVSKLSGVCVCRVAECCCSVDNYICRTG